MAPRFSSLSFLVGNCSRRTILSANIPFLPWQKVVVLEVAIYDLVPVFQSSK